MSQAQLLEIENNLLNTLNLEDLEILVSDLYQKIKEKKETIPIRQATPEEAKAIQEGLDSGIASQEEVREVEKVLGIHLLEPLKNL
jgi:hypothetical protein